MMSLAAIRALSAQQAARAARAKKTPYFVEQDDLDRWHEKLDAGQTPSLPFPNIGDYRPNGFKLVDTLFCDKSGWGSPSEPALTVHQLVAALEVGKGYAIIEEGQFQCYLGVFEREGQNHVR